MTSPDPPGTVVSGMRRLRMRLLVPVVLFLAWLKDTWDGAGLVAQLVKRLFGNWRRRALSIVSFAAALGGTFLGPFAGCRVSIDIGAGPKTGEATATATPSPTSTVAPTMTVGPTPSTPAPVPQTVSPTSTVPFASPTPTRASPAAPPETIPPPPATFTPTSTPTPTPTPTPAPGGVISSPPNGSTVTHQQTASGTFSALPEGYRIWLFLFPDVASTYLRNWPSVGLGAEGCTSVAFQANGTALRL